MIFLNKSLTFQYIPFHKCQTSHEFLISHPMPVYILDFYHTIEVPIRMPHCILHVDTIFVKYHLLTANVLNLFSNTIKNIIIIIRTK